MIPSLTSRRVHSARLSRLFPGVSLSLVLALASLYVGTMPWLAAHGINTLTAAIALGILAGNAFYPRVAAIACVGIAFSKQTLLRAGVVLYGLRLTLRDFGQIGAAGALIDLLVLTSTFALAVTLGTRCFRIDRKTSILIGAGSAICGAAAVMATEPVVQAEARQVTLAISTVVVFGTAAMFLYPALYPFVPNGLTTQGARAFGIYTGSTIHEVAQVFAAGRSVSEAVANTAIITKMVRVMMLAPFLMALSVWIRGRTVDLPVAREARVPGVPWFALAFLGVVIFNSLGLLSPRLLYAATVVDSVLLAMAVSALGLTTHFSAFRAAGPGPLCLGALLFIWLIVGGGAINLLVNAWLL